MTILEINKYHYLKGGADAVFFNTMELLARHGHTVVPFCVRHPRNAPSPYEEYFVTAPEIREMTGTWSKIKSVPRFIYNRDAARRLERLLQAVKPDVAHIHNMFNGLSLAILPVLRRHNIPVVVTMHETRFVCPSSYFMLRGKWCANCRRSLHLNCALRRCYQDSAVISAMSTLEMIHKDFLFNYDKSIARYIFLSHRFMELHGAVRKHFLSKGVILPNFNKSLAATPPEPRHNGYFLYYGRLTAEKGIDTLIAAMKSLPQVRFKIAGTGPMAPQIEQLRLPNVEYCGFVSGDALTSLIANAKFTLVPSQCEDNNPMTIIESYGHGTPVLGARMGGIPEMVVEHHTGLVFEPFSTQSLCDAVVWADKISPSEYKSLSLQAHNFAVTHFEPQAHYARLIKIFEEAISKHENT